MTTPPTLLITGASTGIGEACALEFDRLGWRVLATVRREADADSLRQKASANLTPLLMDVTDDTSIHQAAEQARNIIGDSRLQGLINNAGVAIAGPLEFLPIAELRHQLEVNVIGQVAVTQAFLPMLRQASAPQARIINIGSVSGLIAYPLLGPYNASKFALEAITDSLRMELKQWGIHVALVDPSAIKTPIWEKSAAHGATQLTPDMQQLYGDLIAKMQKVAMASGQHGSPVIKVVEAVVHAMTADKPRTRYLIGIPKPLVMFLRAIPDRRRDALILRTLQRRASK
ncbi:MAG: SDR family oxidoreductase [Anaerolineae bacterium]|nr:SDR family oxidoreductase [Anaerolineae bacterium]